MRQERSIKNIITAVAGQLLSLIFPFITRSIFIRYLSIEYLGLNGLFSNILSILSLSELGLSSAIIFSLYKPVAENDETLIKGLINFYAKIYRKIFFFVLAAGGLVIPFLSVIIKDDISIAKSEIYVIYILFLVNSALSYLIVYKRAILVADQKIYVSNFYQTLSLIITNIFQIIFLVLTKNFIIYILIKIATDIMQNIIIYKRAEAMYPVVRDVKGYEIDSQTKSEIYKKIRALMIHKVGDTVLNSTDNIIMSSFLGVALVGIYSNYYVIFNMLNSVIAQMFYAVTASVGNLNAIKVSEKSYTIYKNIYFANFWIFGFSATGLFIIFDNFISLWIGKDYLLDFSTLIIIVINFYVIGMRRVNLIYRDSLGLYWNDRYKPVITALINIIVSLLLVKQFEITGILLGTLISILLTSFWVEPYILYKHAFKKNILQYFFIYFKYLGLAVMAIILSFLITMNFPDHTLTNLLIKIAVVLLVPNGLFLIVFHRSEEFKYFVNVFKGIKIKNLVKGDGTKENHQSERKY